MKWPRRSFPCRRGPGQRLVRHEPDAFGVIRGRQGASVRVLEIEACRGDDLSRGGSPGLPGWAWLPSRDWSSGFR